MRVSDLRVGDFVTRKSWREEEGYKLTKVSPTSLSVLYKGKENLYTNHKILSDNEWIIVSREEEYGNLRIPVSQLRVGDHNKIMGGWVEYVIPLPSNELVVGYRGISGRHSHVTVYQSDNIINITRLDPNPEILVPLSKQDAEYFVNTYSHWMRQTAGPVQRRVVTAMKEALGDD